MQPGESAKMMPRYVAKTYGRVNTKETYASKAFDDIFKDNRPSTAKAATTGSKWGNAKFTSTRASATPTPPDEVDPKRRKVEAEPVKVFDGEDPFSFDEAEGPVRSSKRTGSERRASPLTLGQNQPKAAKKPVAVHSSRSVPGLAQSKSLLNSNNRTETNALKSLESNSKISHSKVPDEEEAGVKKTVVRTYTRVGRNGAAKPAAKPLTVTSVKSQPDNRKQVSVESFTQKVPCLTLTRDRLQKHNLQNSQPDKPMRKKFFVSSPTGKGADLLDHNYSHPEETSDEDVEQGDSQETKLFESDFEFDSDGELESGDPEIIFNSPKKRALEAQTLQLGNTGESRSCDNNQDSDSEEGPQSPFSVSDDDNNYEVEDNRSKRKRANPEVQYMATYSPTKCTLTLKKAHSASAAGSSNSQGSQRKPLLTYSKSAQQLGQSQLSNLEVKGSGRMVARPGRSDSPASVGSASSVTSRDSSSSQHRTTNPRITYTRKSLLDRQKDKKEPMVRKLLTSPKKSVAVYNPRPWHSEEPDSSRDSPENQPSGASCPSSRSAVSVFDDFDDELPPVKTQPKFKRRVTLPKPSAVIERDPVSTLKITREHKPLFTVVRNVKQAHECQEHGETQEFKDDIEYIMDGLCNSMNESVRCLSTISLVGKCTMPAFRMHLRAHGTLAKIFSALHDAPQYPTLALCTAGVLYMLSRDRLIMDLERSSLELMLHLLSVDAKLPTENAAVAEYERIKKRIQDICDNLKVDGKSSICHLDLVDISPGKLAMETLLSLTSRKAGDWFKEELRKLGGLDHIVSTVSSCSEDLDEVEIEPSITMLDTLKKIDRCLRVLENVTFQNTDNQVYLIQYNDGELAQSICRGLKVCENCQPFHPVEEKEGQLDKESTGYIVFSCMLSILRVLLNLTHDNEDGCQVIGEQPGLMTTVLRCILQVPQYISIEQRFDLLVLSLGLMINMVEHSDANRDLLVESKTLGQYESESSQTQISAPSALVQFFVIRFEAAERLEAEQVAEREQMKKAERGKRQGDPETHVDGNASGQWQESEAGLEWVVIPEDQRGNNGQVNPENDDDDNHSNCSDDLQILQGSQEEDENFTKALHKAGRHMEDSIVAAYVALLVGVVLQHNGELVDEIRELLPNGSFEPMVKMLKKFLGFMNFTSSVGNTGGKSIIRVIQTLQDC